jgi:peroxiredoxin
MALTYSTPPVLGTPPLPFRLVGTDDRVHSLEEYLGVRALLVVFMCNHCPYVQAVDDRINDLAKKFRAEGLRVVGINPNDSSRYPDDSFENMKIRASEKGYVFDYLVDSTQEVAKAFGAVCTPDLFLYGPSVSSVGTGSSSPLGLKYQGRIDDSWKDESKVTRKDLEEAISAVLSGREPNPDQKPSMGCSIKWKLG